MHSKPVVMSILGILIFLCSGCQLAQLEKERDSYRADAERLQGDLDRREHQLNNCAGQRASLGQKVQSLQRQLVAEIDNNRRLVQVSAEQDQVGLAEDNPGENDLSHEFDDIDGLNVTQQGGEIHLQLEQSILFGAGQTRLSSKGNTALSKIAKILRRDYAGRAVRVEGHTDNVPVKKIKKRVPSNWELSCLRSCAVLRLLITKKAVDPLQASALGCADSRPIAKNSSKSGRSKNRRVDIVILTAG